MSRASRNNAGQMTTRLQHDYACFNYSWETPPVEKYEMKYRAPVKFALTR